MTLTPNLSVETGTRTNPRRRGRRFGVMGVHVSGGSKDLPRHGFAEHGNIRLGRSETDLYRSSHGFTETGTQTSRERHAADGVPLLEQIRTHFSGK